MLKWGRKGFGVVFPRKLGGLSHTEGGGGPKKVPPINRGGDIFYPVFRRGAKLA